MILVERRRKRCRTPIKEENTPDTRQGSHQAHQKLVQKNLPPPISESARLPEGGNTQGTSRRSLPILTSTFGSRLSGGCMMMMTTTGHRRNSARFGPLLLPVFFVAVSRGGGFRCSDGDRGEGGTLRLVVMNRARDKDILGDRHRRRRGSGNGVKRDGDGTNTTTVGLPSALRSSRNYPPLTPTTKTKVQEG
jgi:hypothetical protein